MNKTNPRLESLIMMLKRASRENDVVAANIWREIAVFLFPLVLIIFILDHLFRILLQGFC